MIIARIRKTSFCRWPILQREAHQQGDQQRLQHRPAGQRREQRGRDQRQDEPGGALGGGLGGLRQQLGTGAAHLVGQLQPVTRVQDVAHDQADGQRHRRHRDEVAQRQAADPADLRGLPDGADAQHDRAEDDRRDDHLDQADERGAQPLEADAELGEDQPDDDAGDDRGDHRDVEPVRLVPLLAGCAVEGCLLCHGLLLWSRWRAIGGPVRRWGWGRLSPATVTDSPIP
jgi:hypothetical protein